MENYYNLHYERSKTYGLKSLGHETTKLWDEVCDILIWIILKLTF